MKLNEISILDKYKLEFERGTTKLPFEKYNQICGLDPTTTNNKAGKYCNWLLQHVNNNTDLQELKVALEQYHDGIKRGILQRKNISNDITTFKTCEELITAIQGIMKSDDSQYSTSEVNNMKKLAGQYEIAMENHDWLVIAPQTWEAERYFGRGTKWCTVGDEGYFYHYMIRGQLYINYPKNGNLKMRSQFHFEDEAFADVDDNVDENPKNCISKILGENNAFKSLFSLWSQDGAFLDYPYIWFTDVQELLDKGEYPEDVFDKVSTFNEGFAVVELHSKKNWINRNQKLLCPNQWFDEAEEIDHGNARVKLNNKWNWIKANGELLSPNQWFDWVDHFIRGTAKVDLNGKQNWVDTNGGLLSPNRWFDCVDIFINGFAVVNLNDKWNWVDKNIEIICPNQWFDLTEPFYDGFAIVKLNNKYNWLSEKKELLSPHQWYDEIRTSYENAYGVRLGNKWNWVNTDDGNLISPNQWFDWVDVFSGGFATCELNGKYNMVDTNGNILSPNQWFSQMPYNFGHDDFAYVVFDDKYLKIDKNGIFYNRTSDKPLPDDQQPNLHGNSLNNNLSESKKKRIKVTINEATLRRTIRETLK